MQNRRVFRRTVAIASIPLTVAAHSAIAQVTTPVSYTGSTYTQNFDTLPNSGTFTYTKQTTLAPLAVPNNSGGTLQGWEFDNAFPTTPTPRFIVDDGAAASTTGSAYSYGSSKTDTGDTDPGNGTTASADRSLGALASGSADPEFGVILVNNTSTNYNQLTLNYTGEQWHENTGAQNILAFSYSTSAADITTAGAFTTANSLNFDALYYGMNYKNAAGTPGTITAAARSDGNATGNNEAIGGTINIIGGWAPGQTLVLKWSDQDVAGSNQGLAIENLSVLAGVAPSHNLTWNATGGSGVWDVNTTPNWTGDSTYFNTNDYVTFTDGNQGTVTIASGGVQPTSTTVSNTSGTYTFANTSGDANGIAGAGPLLKSGGGTLALTSQNTFSGGTYLTGGTISINNDNNLGNGGAVNISGGTLQAAGGGITLLHSIVVGANGATFDTNGNDVTFGNADGTGGSFTGTGNFIKTGNGNFTDNITPKYTGTTSVTGGTLTLDVGTADVTMTAPPTPGGFTGNLVLNSEMTIDLEGGMIDGGGTVEAKVTGVYIYGSGTDTTSIINNNVIIDTGYLGVTATFGNTLTINGAISGYAGLRMLSGAGILTLGSSSNSYQNQTLITSTNSTGPTVAAGVLRIGANNALPVTTDVVFGTPTTGTPPTAGKAGALDLNGFNQTVDSIGSSSLTDANNNVTYAVANGITNSSSTSMSTLTIDDQGAGYFATYANSIGAFVASDITGYDDIALTLAPTNAGNLTLLGVSTYTGPTTINGGTLVLGTGGSIANSPVTIGSNGILAVTATSGTAIGGLNSTSTAAQLQLNDSVLTISGGGTYAGEISANTDTGGLAITGGTLKLTSGTTTHIGSLSITAGSLDLTNGNLVVDDVGNSAATIIAYIASGYNDGAQDGTGIITSAALTQKGTTLGYIDTGTQLDIKYTWYGDLDLSGTVTASDLTAMNAGNGTSWSQGDLNYDGVKNADDYALFQLGAALQNGSISAGVPEPTALGLVAIPMLMGMRRRRR
jgi:autotransporter-associated beta strand protein